MNGETRTTAPIKPRALRPHIELIELRTNNGWTPNDLALRAGVDGNTVRMAEAGFRPGPRVQFKIARQFDLKPTDLWPVEMRGRARV